MCMEVTSGIHKSRVNIRKLADAFWKFTWIRHRGHTNKYGHHPNPEFKCFLEFNSHWIGGILDASSPARTNDDEHHVGVQKSLRNVLTEVNAQRNTIDIH